MSPFRSLVLTALTAASSVLAHGHVSNIVINGVSYENFDPTRHTYMPNPPVVVGWKTSQTDNGFVGPDAFSSADIVCHRSGANAGGHAVIAAGDRIFIQWNTWPESHHGPVIDYLANCGNSGCESVDKSTLKFFKIDEVGLVGSSSSGGKWGSDQLLANNNSWLVEIPSNIAPGFYVLRHEIIALHSAGQNNGAQNYPQCINLQITGSGTESPEGTLGTALYKANDPGILVNIYQSLSSYKIPGPPLIAGASAIQQGSSAITRSTTAIQGSGTPPPSQPTGGSAGGRTTSGNSRPTQGMGSASSVAPKPTGKITCPNKNHRHHARDIRA
jgi:lytic cellulose monooxygenase (C1-hydroxylating)